MKYQVGDWVKIIRDTSEHQIQLGDIVRIIARGDRQGSYEVETAARRRRFIRLADVELTREPVPQTVDKIIQITQGNSGYTIGLSERGVTYRLRCDSADNYEWVKLASSPDIQP